MSVVEAPPFLTWLVTGTFIIVGIVALFAPRSLMRSNAALYRAVGQVKNEQRAKAESQVLQWRIGGGVFLCVGLFMVFYLIVQPLLTPDG